MTLYIAQQNPHGHTKVWEAADEAEIVRMVRASGYDHDFATAEDAVAHDKQHSKIASCPAHLIDGYVIWPGLIDAVLNRWGVEPEGEVDLDDAEEWAEGTAPGARLSRFQAEDYSDYDGAEIGRVGDFDVIYLPEVERAARVSNGNAEWFDATSFRHASLFAQGAWDGETGRG